MTRSRERYDVRFDGDLIQSKYGSFSCVDDIGKDIIGRKLK